MEALTSSPGPNAARPGPTPLSSAPHSSVLPIRRRSLGRSAPGDMIRMDSPPPAPNRLKSLAPGERPEERIARDGPKVASDSELIAMLLRSGTEGNDVLTLATALVAEAGSLA